MVRRAELKLAVNKRRRVDSAVKDLEEAVRMSDEEGGAEVKTKAFCLLGECYEFKGMREEARKAFEDAIKLEPGPSLARQSLNRLSSS